MIKKILLALALSIGVAQAQVGPGPVPGGAGTVTSITCNGTAITTSGTCVSRVYGVLTNTSQTTSITSGGVVEQFDTQVAGNIGGTICDVTTNKGRCKPTLAGTYLVTCKVDGTATTGPAVSGDLIGSGLNKNGSEIAGDEVFLWSQVAAITAPRAAVSSTNIVTVNGTTDYWECFMYSAATGMAINANASHSSMTYTYVGP